MKVFWKITNPQAILDVDTCLFHHLNRFGEIQYLINLLTSGFYAVNAYVTSEWESKQLIKASQ